MGGAAYRLDEVAVRLDGGAGGTDVPLPVTVANGGTGLAALGSALQVLRTNAGATAAEWATPAGGDTPGGTGTELQYRGGASTLGGVAGTSVTAGTGAIALTAQAATTTPLTIAGAAAQTAPHLRIEPVDAAVNAGVLRQSKQAQGAASKAGLGLAIYGDDAVAGSSSAGAAAGGSVTITAGDAARLTSGNGDGGDVKLTLGNRVGTGRYGRLILDAPGAPVVLQPDSSGYYDFAIAHQSSGANYGTYFEVISAGSGHRVTVGSAGSWGIASTASAASGGGDTLWRRRGAANPAWGLASATPVAYTHSLAADSRAGTDTDTRGAKATLTPGIGTGTGGSGSFAVQTAVQGSTGTTANSTVDRQYVYSLAKALTDGSATGLFEVALPSGSHVGLTIEATVAAENASNYQTRRVAVQLVAHNKGGTVTASTPTEYGASELLDSGALTTTWTVTAGTGKITVNLNADSDLSTQTRLDVRYQLRIEGDTGTLVTEL
jgi:hypothetical protein